MERRERLRQLMARLDQTGQLDTLYAAVEGEEGAEGAAAAQAAEGPGYTTRRPHLHLCCCVFPSALLLPVVLCFLVSAV